MEFKDSLVRFNIVDATKHLVEEHSIFHIDIIYDLAIEVSDNFYGQNFRTLTLESLVVTCDDLGFLETNFTQRLAHGYMIGF